MKENIRILLEESRQTVFKVSELSRILGYNLSSLRVMLSRWTKEGSLVRLRNGMYALRGVHQDLDQIAYSAYAPSYLSLETVLYRAGFLSLIPICTQFVTTRRSKRFSIANQSYQFRKIPEALFVGFEVKEPAPEARPEKALIDLAYFVSVHKATWPRADLKLTRSICRDAEKLCSSLPEELCSSVLIALRTI